MSAPAFDPMPLLIRGDARHLPLADESVDLIVTSPPYWSLRSYSDGGRHYVTQIGSEPTWQEYLDNLISCTREWMRVLKPSGSLWLNMGDKFSTGNSGESGMAKLGERYAGGGHSDGRAKRASSRVEGMPPKSLLNLPHRYAIRCVDELGLIERQDQVWKKANGLPESVTDRTRREHEYLFHLVKQPRYYSAVDEIREPHSEPGGRPSYGRERPVIPGGNRGKNIGTMDHAAHRDMGQNALGKLPGSVWEIATQPLNIPDHISHARCCAGRKRDGCQGGLDHYAAFPFALVRPIILGWSPREVCTACGEGRRPVADHSEKVLHRPSGAARIGTNYEHAAPGHERTDIGNVRTVHRITGYSCACTPQVGQESREYDHATDEWVTRTITAADVAGWIPPPSTPGVVLDPFGGTGAAALVSAMHGRTGISLDASWDYSHVIARWRIHDPKERARAAGLDPDAVARIAPAVAEQFDLFGEAS